MSTLILGLFAVALLIIAIIFIVPPLLQMRRNRLPREFVDLSRDERVTAMAFFYALPQEKLAEIRALPDRRQKDDSLREAYATQNPDASAVEIFSAVSTFFKLYAEEVGLRGGLYHKQADGNVLLRSPEPDSDAAEFGTDRPER